MFQCDGDISTFSTLRGYVGVLESIDEYKLLILPQSTFTAVTSNYFYNSIQNMKATVSSELLFYREQTRANLQFLFGEEVDVLTCTVRGGYNAIAYIKEVRVQVLQASGSSTVKVLEKLHDMSGRRVEAYLAEYTQMRCEDLPACNIYLPRESVATAMVDQFMHSAKTEEAETDDNNDDEGVLPPDEEDNPGLEENYQGLRKDEQGELVQEGTDKTQYSLPRNKGQQLTCL
ncbi:uncharacterized protein BJX67DRAFT_335087 [Aspergillus lucknowensis]|uniref:Uncharacterized protein n=1 Tax=Aspergillus lucknowensis TaxID=176173 RepID=A0ABR4L678_9EURO